MWLEGCCFVAGMGVTLVILPVLGIWGSWRQRKNL